MSDNPLLNPAAYERALLGALVNSPEMVGLCSDLEPAHFFDPRHQMVFAAVLEADRGPSPVPDATVVLAALQRQGTLARVGGGGFLHDLAAVGSVGVNAGYLATFVRHAAGRRELAVYAQRLGQAIGTTESFDDLATLAAEWGSTVEEVSRVAAGAQRPITGLWEVGEMADRASTRVDWVIPGLLGRGDRVLNVATEGAGKSTIMRSFAFLPAWGLHPLLPEVPIPPIRTLMVDLENPQGVSDVEAGRFVDVARRVDAYRPGAARSWLQPDGLDLRKARDAALLDRVLGQVRPDLVTIGPLYKAFRRDSKDADGSSAECAAALDKLRSRYGFALVLEHHAPLGDSAGRTMRPFGSALWQWWPECGFGWVIEDPKDPEPSLRLERFRRDRTGPGRDWPTVLHRGLPGEWPFSASFPPGVERRIRERFL